MKKVLFILCIIIGAAGLSGCSEKTESVKTAGSIETSENTENTNKQFIEAVKGEDGNVVIEIADISETASFVNYDAGGVTVQLIVVKASDGTIRTTFNTCQTCNPAPMAYFVQEGDYFICQNCGNRFSRDEIGLEKGGCNPAPVEEKEEEAGKFLIAAEYLEAFQGNFENWKGPTE